MNSLRWLGLAVLMGLVTGCGVRTVTKINAPTTVTAETSSATEKEEDEEASIQKALAKLSPEDRKLAEEQRFCAVEEESRLGSMGKPVKLMIKDKPVFVCCGGCKKAAERDPDKTLAHVAALQAKNSPQKGTEPKEK